MGVRRIGATFGLLGAAVLSVRAAYAGEPVSAPQKRPAFTEWISEGRRDPFEYKSPTPEIQEPLKAIRIIEEPAQPQARQPDVAKPPVSSEATLRQVRQYAEAKAADAEAYLALQLFDRVLEVCTEALNKIKDAQLADPVLVERLERFRSTATRLKTRTEIEEEFRKLGIELQGIVWEPTNPLAMIKGKTVRRGETVEGALVEEIGPSEVIFLYKGVRCRKGLGR